MKYKIVISTSFNKQLNSNKMKKKYSGSDNHNFKS